MNKVKSQKPSHSTLPKKGTRGFIYYYILLWALMLLFAIYTATKFPYTYITIEGDNFWVLTRDFWQLKLATLPAVTNWIADYLMQFYGSPYVAATIQALVLGTIGVLASCLRPLRKGAWLWLGLLPPVFLGYFCTFCLSFHLQCLFFFALLLVFIEIPNQKIKLVWSLVCVTLGFMLMRTPLLALLIVAQAALFSSLRWSKRVGIAVAGVAILALMPLIYSQQIAFIPFEQRYTAFGTYFDPITSQNNRNGENINKMVTLSNDEQWEDLLYREHIKRDAVRGNAVALRYALLAESALGTLPENLLDYPIHDENLFYFPHEQNRIAQQFNRLFYLNLGIYDEAFHQAQEYSLLQPNGNSFSSIRQLVDYSIAEGEWDIAEKFLQVLSKSSCHKKFILNSKFKIQNSKKLPQKRVEDIPLRADNFVGGYPLPIEMLRLARYYNAQEKNDSLSNVRRSSSIKKMLDYAICSYMLRGDVNGFLVATKAFDIYKDKELPRAYKEFLEASQSHTINNTNQ